MRPLTVYVASAAALVIGLFFIFVWAPHPWGWQGFDLYYDLGRTLARGGSFPTMDVPWGYAYFLAPFYRLFGDRPWIPLVAQVGLNALVPLFVYQLARREFDERVAVVAALLTGFLSFNTVYASTQSSDAVCNVIFIAAIALFVPARRRGGWWAHALVGAMLGIAAQFRPNLILVPLLLAAFLMLERRTMTRVVQAIVLLTASTAMLMPWLVRNYRLTGEIMPTSTHGGLQLWYGTLQTGPFLKSRAYNPRAIFEMGSFPYTSLDRVPLVVTGRVPECAALPAALSVVYWTDRDPVRHHARPQWLEGRGFRAELAPSPAPTVYYFYFDGVVPSREAAPYVYFVSGDHLGDLDRHGDMLDVFDIVRLLRHLAWKEPVAGREDLDFDGDGRLSEADLRRAVDLLLAHAVPPHQSGGPIRVDSAEASAALRWDDGSSIGVPRAWSGRITEIEASGELAAALLHSTVPFALLRAERPARAGTGGCAAARERRGERAVLSSAASRDAPISRAGDGQYPPRSAGVLRRRRVPGPAGLLHRRQQRFAHHAAVRRWQPRVSPGIRRVGHALRPVRGRRLGGMAPGRRHRAAAAAHSVHPGDPRVRADEHAIFDHGAAPAVHVRRLSARHRDGSDRNLAAARSDAGFASS